MRGSVKRLIRYGVVVGVVFGAILIGGAALLGISLIFAALLTGAIVAIAVFFALRSKAFE